MPPPRTAACPATSCTPCGCPAAAGSSMVTVVDYEITDIGTYVEYRSPSRAPGPRPAPPLLPRHLQRPLRRRPVRLDLPVSSEISVKGGKGIWGMPKHQANLDFRHHDRTVSSQYDVDGLLCLRIEIDRPPAAASRWTSAPSTSAQFRGMVMRSSIYFRAPPSVARGPAGIGAAAPRRRPAGSHRCATSTSTAAVLHRRLPTTHGVLDDHFECWFLMHESAPAGLTARPEGLESVAELDNDTTWLEPPIAAGRGQGAPAAPS